MQRLPSVHPVLDVDKAETVLDVDPIRASWFNRPLANRWCVLGWVVATAVFVGITQLLGGPTRIAVVLVASPLISAVRQRRGSDAAAMPPGSGLTV